MSNRTRGMLPARYINPPLITLGDSMMNGMRTVTVRRDLADRSVPAMVSRALAPTYTHLAPAYPEPLLMDIEGLIVERNVAKVAADLSDLIAEAWRNASRWMARLATGDAPHPTWDNLGLAGAQVHHLLDLTAADFANLAADQTRLFAATTLGALTTMQPEGAGVFDRIVDLHMGLNGQYLLNPQARPEMAGLTAVDIVERRRPRNLLINVGANHGLFEITMSGNPDAGFTKLEAWVEEMERLAERLARLPDDTRCIYFATIPLPSTVPNLGPPYLADFDYDSITRHDGYFPLYDARLSFGPYFTYDWRQVRDFDRRVARINQHMIDRVGGAFRRHGKLNYRFFRLDELLVQYDGRADRTRAVTAQTPGASLKGKSARTYTNHPLDFRFARFASGGYSGLDNHHPSGLGYSLYAHELLKVMAVDYPEINPLDCPISDKDDDLLHRKVVGYSSVLTFFYEQRRRAAGYPVPVTAADIAAKPGKRSSGRGRKGAANAREFCTLIAQLCAGSR